MPADKANSNVAGICKRFCALALLKEQGYEKKYLITSKNYESCMVWIRPLIS